MGMPLLAGIAQGLRCRFGATPSRISVFGWKVDELHDGNAGSAKGLGHLIALAANFLFDYLLWVLLLAL